MHGPLYGLYGPYGRAMLTRQDVRTGLVLAYDTLALTAGGLLQDDSGLGNHATIVGAIVGAGSISFDGTDDYLSRATAVTSPGAGVTLSLWIKNATTSSTRALLSITQASSNRASLQIISNALVGGYYNGAAYTDWSSTLASTTDWLHVAMTYSATTNLVLYQNTATGADTGTALVAAASLGTVIGARTSLNALYAGLITHVRVYSRALSAPEIATLYGYQRAELGV